MNIVFPDETPAISSPEDITPLTRIGECVVYHDNPANKEELIGRVGNAEAIIIGLSRIGADVMAACPCLRYIGFLGAGASTYVDVTEATKRGICVTNTPGYGTQVVAEHALALLLAVTHRVVQADRAMRQNIWEQTGLEVTELLGKTLGLVGLGPVGARVAELAKPLGLNVLCYTRKPSARRASEHGVSFTDLETLLQTSDLISLHIAYTRETYHLIDMPQFQIMKRNGVLVNTARGEIVNTEALYQALQTKQIAGAGLDVYEEEPLPRDHPLLGLENVVLTPHISWNSREASKRMLQIAMANAIAFSEGKPINVVNRYVLGRSAQHRHPLDGTALETQD